MIPLILEAKLETIHNFFSKSKCWKSNKYMGKTGNCANDIFWIRERPYSRQD